MPARPFEGRHAAVAGTLDLRRIQSLTETMRELTGSAQNVYSLTLLPQVSVSGRVGESPIDSTFAPALAFELADLRLQPSRDDSDTGTGAGLGPFAPREALRRSAQILLIGAALGLVLISALAAGNAVPATRAGLSASAISVDSKKPKPDCNAITLTSLVVGTTARTAPI